MPKSHLRAEYTPAWVPLCLTYGMYIGAGLGRLCLELTNQGFEVQGNEFSYYMLLTSSFILNNTERAEQWTVFPWMHSNCNQKSIANQLRGVGFCCSSDFSPFLQNACT